MQKYKRKLPKCEQCGKVPIVYRDISSELSIFGAYCVIKCSCRNIQSSKASWNRALQAAISQWNN